MSLVACLVANRTPMELAKELASTVKENAQLKDRAYALEIEVFWLKAAERDNKEKPE